MSGRTKIEKLEQLINGSIDGELIEQTLEPLVPPGENFGSVIYGVDFKVKNGEKVQTYHGVAKCTPPNQVTQEIFDIQVATKAEIAWYTTLIPTFINFQQEHGVEQIADFFQNFYGARISLDPDSDIVDMDAVILTENLKPLGYKNIDRHIGFDLKTSKTILTDLAAFHAVPMAIKLKNIDLFDKNIRPFLPGLQMKKDSKTKDVDKFNFIINGFKEIPEIVPHVDRIVTYMTKNKSFGTKPVVREPWGSICHNDFWINNIMVKDGDNTRTVFLDFQMPSYDTVAVDLLFFLVVSVNVEVIEEYMDELIKFYWDEFLKNLKYFDIDESLFTYEEFLKEIDSVAHTGLFTRSILHTFIIFLDKGKTDFDSSDENFKKENLEKFNFSLNDRHRKKYTWLVLEFVKRGWL